MHVFRAHSLASVYGDRFRIKIIILICDRWYHGLKWMSFLAKSHLFAFNTLRIVYSMKEQPIIYLHHTFVAKDASFGTIALSDVIPCVQKRKKCFKFWLRQTVTNMRLSFVYTRNYCPVIKDAVSVPRSDWPRGKWDHAYYCRKGVVNNCTFYDKPWGIGLAAIWSFVAEAKIGLPLLSPGVLRSLRRVSRKKLA